MANQLRVTVQETTEELQHRLKRAVTAHSKERLQMLYWLKTQVVNTRSELARAARTRRIDNLSLAQTLSARWDRSPINSEHSTRKSFKDTSSGDRQTQTAIGTAPRVQQLWSDSAVVGNRMWGRGSVSYRTSNGAVQT